RTAMRESVCTPPRYATFVWQTSEFRIANHLVNAENASMTDAAATTHGSVDAPSRRELALALVAERGFGNPAADQWTCSLVMQRGVFRPARDARGQPVPAWFGYKQADTTR
ncbi:MAG: hypothetical protein ACREBK_02455, partial [Sphingomicrobium sp.]